MSLWTLFWIFVVVIPVVALWIYGLVDLFRRRDLSTARRILWAALMIVLPLLGVICHFYLAPKTSLPRDSGERPPGRGSAGILRAPVPWRRCDRKRVRALLRDRRDRPSRLATPAPRHASG